MWLSVVSISLNVLEKSGYFPNQSYAKNMPKICQRYAEDTHSEYCHSDYNGLLTIGLDQDIWTLAI